MGITTIWGSITVYVTSYLRVYNPSLTMSVTYIIFPVAILTCALTMQVGSILMDRMHPKLQLGLGTALFALPVIACSFVTSFPLFVFLYSFVVGLGLGITYMLPIRNAWLFYPERKGMVSGMILAAKGLGSIF